MIKWIKRVMWLAIGVGCSINCYNGLHVIIAAHNDFDLSTALLELACINILLYTVGRCADGVCK